MMRDISCEGAPRDQGLTQGALFRNEIRDWVARLGGDAHRSFLSALRPLTSGPVLGTGVGREVLRHHPHMAERTDGIARGARLPLSSLMELLIPGRNQAPISGPAASDAVAHAALLSGADGGTLLRELPAHAAPGCRFLLRHSVPEVGFRSVEVTLPWQASCVAGVNERGLAIAIVPEPECTPSYSFAPPAILLVQDCLQRFADLDSALEWCAERPSAPGVSIAISDASGECAAAVLTADGCRVRRSAPDQATLVCGGSSDSRAEIAKRLDAGDDPLRAIQSAGAGALFVNPRARSIRVQWPGSSEVLLASVTAPESP